MTSRPDENAPASLAPTGEPPLEAELPVVGKPKQAAAGITSIYVTAKYGFAEMGVGRTFDTLLALNQKDGFDCPSCAWPDPDGERKTAEFCENGAKAVAEEATTRSTKIASLPCCQR